MPEIKDKGILRQVETLTSKLRRRQLAGAQESAIETTLLIKYIVAHAKFATIHELIAIIKAAGRRLVEAQPKEHTVGNVVRRILRLIREEWAASVNKPVDEGDQPMTTEDSQTETGEMSTQSSPRSSTLSVGEQTPLMTPATPRPVVSDSQYSLSNFVLHGRPHREATDFASVYAATIQESSTTPKKSAQSIRPALISAIEEVMDELETVFETVSSSAKDHIHSDEIVLTLGMSRTVEAFLKKAALDRKFTALVAEAAPSFSGHQLAQSLASSGINTILIPDSAVYAVMSRVNKVILGAHAILANGGVYAVAGSILAAHAAQTHRTPVVFCAGQFKLSPLWNVYHTYGSLDFANPAHILGFQEGKLMDQVDVLNPAYDYVPPELINVFITNDGDIPPASMNRLVKETYDNEDYQL
ncbi:Probable translation initiation factor eIF-2B subunit beta AltName: Full=eIF-2B GDP-GTP exchange factor subunit beta [Serendipita indica DSM 11827]|uniref:Translation initiation factor eIF2B subunit beta n=1 Tax=Serendipita indica (strain DSM 11827) TaxID=1109443 RepID=G4TBY9_SERID|nr:Probable translation initiation factor eIF-2B subunit beta AltName: Full=eIF-2B GDP-GTP exchange factor subunit beta [Serendipita indica DSM 11827]CCA68848.1 related to GCD7-translation initiation factor eIF2b, 43 kDa subunit [Serendipita indica DSM 11827]